MSRETTKSLNLMDAFIQERDRVRDLHKEYLVIGAPGLFGAVMLNQLIQRADACLSSGDTVAMLRIYEELKECN